MPANQVMQTDLALMRGVEAQLGAIVHMAERTVILLEGLETSGMEENQLRNVLDVAQESQSVPVVVNFVRYQIGRARTGEHWQYNGFGLQVIDDIEKTVAEAAQRVATVGGTTNKHIQAAAHVRLMIDYLGFLNRAFIYIRKTSGGWERLSTLVAERTNAQREEESDA